MNQSLGRLPFSLRHAVRCCGLTLALALAPEAQAASYCVNSTAELRSSLAAAAASAEDDIVRVEVGTYTLGTNLVESIEGGLTLRGGYNATCTLRTTLDPAATRITHTASTAQEPSFLLYMGSGDYLLEGFTFDGLRQVTFDDGNSVAGTVDGTLRVQRNRFSNGRSGLTVVSHDKDLRIENNVMTGNDWTPGSADNLDTGLQVRHPNQVSSAITVDILFNTIVGNPRGLLIQGGGPFASAPRIQNNILRPTSGEYALKIDDLDVGASNNVWGLVTTEDGGGFGLNTLNVNADPMLDAALVPQPGSPAVNSGTDFVAGGVPSLDHDGGPRTIGSRPDRGAFESPTSDIGVLVVTSTASSGAGTLRQAIIDSNLTTNAEVIRFNLGGACPQVILLASPLPDVTSPITIDGFSQPGSAPNESMSDYDGVHCVVLSGAVAHALRLEPPAERLMKVSGLAFYGFSQAAIEVEGEGAVRIEGNVFGTGANVLGNAFATHAISVTGAAGSIIGGEDVAQRNVIGRAANAGIYLGPGRDRQVRWNLIGIGANGFGDVGNGVGIRTFDAVSDLLRRNSIGFSTTQGILVEGTTPTSTHEMIIDNSSIGFAPRSNPDAAIGRDAGNGTNGVRITKGYAHQVQSNTIAHNGTDGLVVLADAERVLINSNRIFGNGQLGIDLSPNGVDPQDPDVGGGNGTGGNEGHNFPLLTMAIGGAEDGVVTGTLNSDSGPHQITFYSSTACDDSGHGEGETYAGAVDVSIPFGPNDMPIDTAVPFTAELFALTASTPLTGRFITAIAHDSENNSSEFSACVPYQQGPQVFDDGFEPE